MKIAELYWQLRGEAGARQVPGDPRRGIAQAWGDLMQVGTVVVMGTQGASGRTATEGPAGTGASAPTPPPVPRARSLSEDQFLDAPGAVEHAVDARYEWDTGVAIGRFLEGLRQGRILGRSCTGCNRVLVPPRMFCERCFRATDAWVEVGTSGTIETFSVCHVTWDMERLATPQIPAVVSLDGSESGRNALLQSFALARDEKCWLTAATVVPGVDVCDLQLVGLGDVRAALSKPGEAILSQALALADAERVQLKAVLEEGEAWEPRTCASSHDTPEPISGATCGPATWTTC